jgi:hypothetical protein
MKNLFLTIMLLLSTSLYTQERELKITVINLKGKPIRSVKAEMIHSKISALTDKTGILVIKGFSEEDSVLISFPGSEFAAIYPVKGINELHFNNSKNEQIAYDPATQSWMTGKSKKILRKGEFDVESEIRNGATNLEDLLKRMPSLMVTGGTLSLRNPVQTKEFSNTAPLIVVDNVVIRGGLQEANRVVNINFIESIKVERDGTLWGKDAVNGAILIRLKKQL